MSVTDRADASRRSSGRSVDWTDRQLPVDLNAEVGVLGSVMLLPDVCDEIALILRPEDFYDDANRRLFQHLLAMHDEGSKIDPTLLFDRLKRSGDLEVVGGAAYVGNVIHAVPNAAHAIYYANIVRQKATYRSLIQATTDILRDAYEESQESKQLLSQAEQKIFAILDSRGSASVSSIREILHEAMDRIDARMRGEHTSGGVDTRFTELDLLTGGLHNSELVILAARPSMGKTALAMNIAENVAIKSQVPVLFVSLEMSAIELADRMLCSVARVNGHRLRNGTISNDDRRRLVQKAGEISQAPLFVDDSPSRLVTEIAAAARRIRRREQRLGLIVIDYLQLIEPDNSKDSRQEQVARITRRLKGLAREMHVPILCLAQLNRQAEDSKEHRPRLSHLRECVAGDTPVQLADGRRVAIRDLVGQQPEVLCINQQQQVVSAQSDAVWCVGRRPLFEVRLTSGRCLRATAEHRLLAGEGWKKINDLKVGDRLAVVPRVPEPVACGGGSHFRFSPSRAVLAQYGEILQDEVLQQQSKSDLCWDRVSSISAAGEEEVFDLTVPGPANWLADGIVTHNSGAIEQDADVVMFVHREEYYHHGEDQKDYAGQAEVIIAKQRNGPVGTVELVWRKEYTRFEDKAPDRYEVFDEHNAGEEAPFV